MRLKSNKWNFGTHKIVLFRKSLVPFVVKKKDMELDEIKYLYLLFIPLLVVLFFSIPIGK
jgi:hypothetical protein